MWTSVSKSTFAKTLPAVLEAIKAADFVAFDTELTGLHLSRQHRNGQLDDLQMRYAKQRECVANFGLLQVGLACFSWHGEKEKYAIKAYSFYVHPSAANGLQQERKFTCQLGSLAFLTEHDFDFNMAFREGIPFITRREEEIIKNNSAFYSKKDADKPMVALKDEEKAFVGEILEHVDAWLEGLKRGQDEEYFTSLSKQIQKCTFSPQSIELPPLNSFQRLIFYQQIPLKYGDTLQITKKAGNILSICPSERDPAKREAILQEEKAQFERALQEQVGFRVVIDALIDGRVPLIGHNCLIDVMHFYHKFIDSQFPGELTDFKTAANQHFPIIFDTKFLAKQAGITENALNELTNWTANLPEYSFFPEKNQKAAEEKFHDAGFDSVCTGRAFLALLHRLKQDKSSLFSDPLALKNSQSIVKAAIGSPLSNRLNIMQSDYEWMSLDPAISDPQPDRSNVLFWKNIPAETVTSTLQNELNTLAGTPIVSQVVWIDDGSCFVQLESAEIAESLLKCESTLGSLHSFSASQEESIRKRRRLN